MNSKYKSIILLNNTYLFFTYFKINIIFIEKGRKDNKQFLFENMKTETQNLIVTILGFYALVSLIGIIVLSSFTTHDNEIILALVPVTTTPISILGGFIAGKTLTEKQEEDLLKQNEENSCEDILNMAVETDANMESA